MTSATVVGRSRANRLTFALKPIDLLLDAVESRFDGRQIVAVESRLFEDVTRDELLALDFVLQYLELSSGHVSRHGVATPRSTGKISRTISAATSTYAFHRAGTATRVVREAGKRGGMSRRLVAFSAANRYPLCRKML